MASSLLQCLGSKRFTHGGSKKFTMHDDIEADSAAADAAHADGQSSERQQQQQQQQEQGADASRDAAAPAAAGDQVVIELGPLATSAAVAAAAPAPAAGPAAPSNPWKIAAKPVAATGAATAPDTALSNPDSSKQPAAASSKDAAGAAAAGDAAGGKGVLAKTSVGAALQRTSVYGLTGAAPVGIITLEDVLEELMQVGVVAL
jgi:hypothetical protein